MAGIDERAFLPSCVGVPASPRSVRVLVGAADVVAAPALADAARRTRLHPARDVRTDPLRHHGRNACALCGGTGRAAGTHDLSTGLSSDRMGAIECPGGIGVGDRPLDAV